MAAFLMKPVEQTELLRAIYKATGRGSATTKTAVDAEETASLPALNILLAEDSVANQKLAVGLLESWGHSVRVAENGQQAVVLFVRLPNTCMILRVE